MSASPSYESLAWADMAFAAQLPGVRRLTVTQPLAQNQNNIVLYQYALGRLLAEVTPAKTRLIV
uniref:hypothetical protein n=1 Tax=uncultured Caulobacter sp. TaxID=158749 RepID=UPI0025F5BF77|nr:hypothetical protein [uncultured Caulobacter sp.]